MNVAYQDTVLFLFLAIQQISYEGNSIKFYVFDMKPISCDK